MSLRDPWRDSDRKPEIIADAQREGLPVIATFLQNKGRTAMTVTRCRWVVGEFFTFEPQRSASPWGDLLPVRIEPNDEAVVVHEAEQMRYFLEAVMSDHHVREIKLGLVFDLGNAEMLEAEPLLKYKRSMSDRDVETALAGRLKVSPVLATHPFNEG